MRRMLTAAAAVALAGCATVDGEEIARGMYNIPETGMSEFDGSRYARVRNITCTGDSFIQLDLYQDSEMARAGSVLMTAKVPGIRNLAGGKSLRFNIDGEHVELATIDHSTATEEVMPAHYSAGFVGYGTYVPSSYSGAVHVSTRRYTAQESLVAQLATAEKAIVRVNLSRQYIEASCGPAAATSDESPAWFADISAPAGFARFTELTAELD